MKTPSPHAGGRSQRLQLVLEAAQVYKVRRPLATDKHRSPVFVSLKNPHLIVVGLFGWRILLRRSGPTWWQVLNHVELWKYYLPWRRK